MVRLSELKQRARFLRALDYQYVRESSAYMKSIRYFDGHDFYAYVTRISKDIFTSESYDFFLISLRDLEGQAYEEIAADVLEQKTHTIH
ncbi:hypothetical protein 031MP004_11 [Bacillus phage 031MP004]|nr:hypothetical protein 031MP004_11 [Bacillus phage 031MP004]